MLAGSCAAVTKASDEVPVGLTKVWWLSLVDEGEVDSGELSPPMTHSYLGSSRVLASLAAFFV